MKLLKFTLLGLLLTVVFACSETEDEALPDNVISDSEGLVIDLEWSTGGSASKAQSDADLELYLLKGSDEIDSSAGTLFESVDLRDVYADGTYLIQVEYYRGNVDVDYTLFLSGDSSTESVEYTGTFRSDDMGLVVDYLEVQKSGDTYTIIDL